MATEGQTERSPFETAEPRFYAYWIALNGNDPQIDRWIEWEGNQIEHSRERVKMLTGHFGPLAGKRVLDVGSQWASTCIALAEVGAIPTGIDVDPEYVEGSKIRLEEQGVTADLHQGFAENLPFADDAFDAVICLNIIEHVASHEGTISEMLRVLKPGGRFYLDGPNRFAPTHLKSDQHYQLPGVSWLPHWLGKFYIERVRKFPSYEVGVFPIASVIERRLNRNGAIITASSRTDEPSRKYRRLPKPVQFNLASKFWFVGTKG